MAVLRALNDCGCKSASANRLGVSLALNADLCEILSAAADLTPHITQLSNAPVNGGACGDIWTAYYGDLKVGLKTMRALVPSSPRRQVKHLLAELKSLTRLSHPNVLELLGVCAHPFAHPFGLALVSPWMEHGDLQQYLRLNPDVADRPSLIMDIASGMHYLHTCEPPVVHGDIRSRNILINPLGRACLADFDLSRVVLANEGREISGSLTPYGGARWMSPERMLPEVYGLTPLTSLTPAADTYAFGMVIYEIFTGAVPFPHLTTAYAVAWAVLRGKRPLHPGHDARERGLCDIRWGIAQDCWAEIASDRPSAQDLLRRLAATDKEAA